MQQFTDRISKISRRNIKSPELISCVRDENTQVSCNKDLSREEFHQFKIGQLATLACQAPRALHGLLRRYELDRRHGQGVLQGLVTHLLITMIRGFEDGSCDAQKFFREELRWLGIRSEDAFTQESRERDSPASGSTSGGRKQLPATR